MGRLTEKPHRRKPTALAAKLLLATAAVAAVTIAASPGLAQPAGGGEAGATGGIVIDPRETVGTVGPYVYGANFGPLSAIPVDLFDLAKASGIRHIRFPGGNWGDRNDIRPFEIDMLMRMADLVGAEPSVHVRLQNGTPGAAAELVRYANIENDYDIRHWYIGNEPSLFDDYDVATLNREWRAIAEAMLAVDPDIILVGPEPHQWNGLPGDLLLDADGQEWVEGFLSVNGDLVDVVAVHRYPFPRNAADPGTSIADLRENTTEWTGLLSRLRSLSTAVTGRSDLHFAVTEVNSHWSGTTGGEATNDSAFNAVWWADVLGKLIYDGAYMVNYFDLQSSNARGGWGLLSSSGARPSYYVYQLYQRFGAELLSASSSEPHVSAYAARREDGLVSVIVTNLNDVALEVPVDFAGPVAVSETLLLDSVHLAKSIASPLSEDGSLLSLPARSATLLLLELPGAR